MVAWKFAIGAAGMTVVAASLYALLVVVLW